MMKICKKCGRELPLECFSKRKASKDGLQPYCKECMKQFYAENREDILTKMKQYGIEHKEEIKQYKAKRYVTLEGYAYNVMDNNIKADRKYGRCGKDEDILPSLEYYIWALQQPDFYDGKQYHWSEMGLDRIYNDKPHTFANVVPCSTANNKRRGRKSFEEFRTLIQKEREEFDLVLN